MLLRGGSWAVAPSTIRPSFRNWVGPERAGEFVRDLGKRDPDARLNLLLTGGRRIIATRRNDTLSILHTRGVASRASPMTTTRAGPTSPTITSSTWPTAW